MLLLLRRQINLPLDRRFEIHLPRHNNRREPHASRTRLPDAPLRAAQLGEPFALGRAATDGQLRCDRVDAGFGQQGDVLALLVRHGSVGVVEAGADLGFALVEQVPVFEGVQGAGGWDDEGLVAVGRLGHQRSWDLCLGHHRWGYACLGHSLRSRLDDVVGHLIG